MSMIGMARRIDQLGRVVVPAEFRKMLRIDPGDQLEMRVEDDRLVLMKVTPACALCGGESRLIGLGDKFVCNTCANKIRLEPECALCQRVDDLRELHGKFVCRNCVSEITLV
jgi:transcriptional pleiotropic regulator of transition state genes